MNIQFLKAGHARELVARNSEGARGENLQIIGSSRFEYR